MEEEKSMERIAIILLTLILLSCGNKSVRVSSKTEIHPEVEDEKAPRLVFEQEYLESLPEYKMINLNFQHAFTDTFLGRVLK